MLFLSRPYRHWTLTACQLLSVVAFLLGAGSVLGLPVVIILLLSCCIKLGVCWFIAASIFSLLAALQAGAVSYFLLNWREFWDEVIKEIREDLDKEISQETEDRIYKNFEDYEFFGYIAIGIAALWLLNSLWLCYFSGSYKRFLHEMMTANNASTSPDQEQPRVHRDTKSQNQAPNQTDAPTLESDVSWYNPDESLA